MNMEYLSFTDEQVMPIISAIAGVLLTILANIIREQFRQTKQKNSIELVVSQKKEQEYNRNINEQISLLVLANTSYREEIRKDLESLKKEMHFLTLHYEHKMDLIKEEYEKQIKELKSRIEEMGAMLTEYRKENSLLHKILQEEKIQIPEWATVAVKHEEDC